MKSPVVTIMDNRNHWILRRRTKSVLRSEVSDGYNKEYSNRRVLRYIEKPGWEMAGRGSQLATSAPAPPRYVLQVTNGFETRGLRLSLLPLHSE